MTEKERMLSGKLYNPYKVNDGVWENNRQILEKFNNMSYKQKNERMYLLTKLFGSLGENSYIEPPFYCDKGAQIYIGKHFYANTGLLILDEAEVRIGDYVYIAPRVCIYTAGHPIDTDVRNLDLEYAKPVSIGDNVWIGGNVVINPGVTIESDVVIGSGSVVTKDIPNHVIAAGNPCKVIRKITDEDKKNWQQQLEEYYSDCDIN